MSKRVVVVLAPGFEEIEAVTPIDVLRRAGVEVTIAGVGGTAIEGSHGVTFQCDVELEKIDATPDAIILPGGLPGSENLGKSQPVQALTRKVQESDGVCAAIGAKGHRTEVRLCRPAPQSVEYGGLRMGQTSRTEPEPRDSWSPFRRQSITPERLDLQCPERCRQFRLSRTKDLGGRAWN